MHPPQLLTPDEAAALLRVSTKTLEGWPSKTSDRIAAVDCIQFPADLIHALLNTGVDGDSVLVSPGGAYGAAGAQLLADLADINLRTLMVDIWLACKETSPVLRERWFKYAGRLQHN